ncbi:type II toxin-antitoxin system PrlF family antitoxin [Endozoicomonas gorgoniicola]|uniref:Type II toxin-antitoxin system PrlF family antitoxin n=1 Tax=Endozoicomonas gorgoniicola TaxID=1234144 RepID=A0ABT3MVE4_9GAMM|nr:type II toxin-antitoxin system PrlF family antitoxin [Endozoicomonas gorgoniicola]MCW7553340.1 type II toxin-antitoxin system PrlF family antitoxin [Endozoicomonas gorgoniicola]
MKITSQGQVTIPASIRKSLGLLPGDRVLFIKNDKGEIVIRKAQEDARDPVEEAASQFKLNMSADELMKLLRDDH